jgi:DNA end-binding protein Ku
MPHTVWKGSIAFGMVSIPVKLVSATEEKDISLRQVHEADGGRIRYKRFCSIDDEEVPYAEIAKGYEVNDEDMVVLKDEDFANLPIASTKAVEVLSFADRDEINPIALSRAYYADPTGDAKPYVLLHDTLQATNKVAIVKLALRQKERLATIRAQDGVLVIQTILWPDEIRTPALDFMNEDVELRAQELEMATMYVEAFNQGFHPEDFHDDYREALQQLVDAKIAGQELVSAPEAPEETNVVDLMEALRASVAQAGTSSREGAKSAGSSSKSTSKKAAAKESAESKPGTKKSTAKKATKKATRKTA